MKIGEKVKMRGQVFAVAQDNCRDYTDEIGTLKAFPDPLGALVLFADDCIVRIPVSVLEPA